MRVIATAHCPGAVHQLAPLPAERTVRTLHSAFRQPTNRLAGENARLPAVQTGIDLARLAQRSRVVQARKDEVFFQAGVFERMAAEPARRHFAVQKVLAYQWAGDGSVCEVWGKPDADPRLLRRVSRKSRPSVLRVSGGHQSICLKGLSKAPRGACALNY